MDIREISPGEAAELLAEFGLRVPEAADVTLGAFDGGRLVGCGSLVGDMLQGLAVTKAAQGEGVLARLATALVNVAAGRGADRLLVVTRPETAQPLMALGFEPVASAPPYAAMLAFGGLLSPELSRFRAEADGKPLPRAAIVMNANPFTLGHLHLVQRASAENGWVFVLVVQQDASEFSFRDRIELVRRGTGGLSNVSVIPGGPLVVSSATFPAYFTKRQDLAPAQAALDAAVFAGRIAPALDATRRYVGTEPQSPVTEAYNRALMERLPRDGITLTELPRIEVGSQPVSASRVRTLLQSGDLDGIRPLVPDTTYDFLKMLAHGDA